MIYPADFESKIGFDIIRDLLARSCASRLGREEAFSLSFSTSFKEISHNLKSVAEMRSIIEASLPFPAPTANDVAPFLTELRARNSFISASRLYSLMQMMRSFQEVLDFFKKANEESQDNPPYPHLQQDMETLTGFPSLIRVISEAVDKYGEVKDNASPELYEIRESLRRANGSMQRAMRRVLDSAVAAGIVDKDASPAIRDGRLVLPVSAGNKRALSGIVHDESATGKTVYIEPAEVVEAGNRIRELEIEEKREVTAILMRIADCIRPEIDDIMQSCVIIGHLDLICAKAKLAIELNASLPHLSEKPEIEWYHAFHPGLYISLKKQNREVVPLSLTLSKEKRILIISGPNAGGKSVCLKTVAAVQYMMQCGILPTLYDNSHMGVFDKIFIDIGDEQSFENDLSTYSSHLKNMKFFLQNADSRTLFLADEMGSGTEPQIGGAMAQAILERLSSTDCFGVVTTHYQNLKTFAENTPGFVNGAMLYDRQHLQPTFQLSVGNPGSSFALDIAHKMGLPLDVINEAKRLVGEDYVNIDSYLSDIARDRKYWANKRQNIREKESKLDTLLSKYEEVAGDLKSQRKAIINDARKEAKEILAEANARIERTILEIRKSQAEKERTKEERRKLKEYTESVNDAQDLDENADKLIKPLRHKKKNNAPQQKKIEEPQKRSIVAGDYVTLDGSSTVGNVISVSGKKCVVSFGNLRTIVEVDRLKLAKKPKESLNSASSLSSSTYEESRQRQLNFKNEIDVRGMRADEAIQAVTYFIDDALQFNAGKVRILHGTGHGILKTMIRQQLKANTAVASFEDEDIRFGGAGITVVYLN